MRIHLSAPQRRYIFITLMLFWFVGPAFCGHSDDQHQMVSFSGTHMTLGKAIHEIEAQTPYTFVFNTAQLDTGLPVRFSRPALTVAEALAEMFGNRPYKAVVRNGFIGIAPEAVRAEQNAPQTDPLSGYRPTDPASRGIGPLHRPDSLTYSDDAYQIERIVTVVPATGKRHYPESHSDYHTASYHSKRYTWSPRLAVKTNLLYAGALLTPNLAVEIAVGPRRTLELNGSYRWWGRTDIETRENHKQLTHWIVRPEYRWWSCERFNGAYFGVHALYSRYYVSGRELPLLFDKKHSYDGHALGAGVTYGYHRAVGKRWSVEFNIGVGYAYLWHDRGSCLACKPEAARKTKHYIGPTRAGVNLIYLLR